METRIRVRSLIVVYYAYILLSTMWSAESMSADPNANTSETTPLAYFQKRRERMPPLRVYHDILSNIPTISADFEKSKSKRLFLRIDVPTKCVDLSTWSDRDRGYELPLYWNKATRRFEVLRGQIEESSDAIVDFTWYFLRAYDGLAPELRESGSTLALGMAALVACEATYPSHHACLPAELINVTAITNILILYEPDLVVACFGNERGEYADKRRSLVRKAVGAMCAARDQKTGKVGKIQLEVQVHEDTEWLLAMPADSAIDGQPVSLQAFLPPHASALNSLLDKVCNTQTLNNLTIRAVIVAASCPARYGLPFFRDDARKQWEQELVQLLEALSKELEQRGARYVAPAYHPTLRREYIVGDPSILRPLMTMATQALARELPNPRKVTEAEYLRALKGSEAQDHPGRKITSRVIQMAGSDPLVEIGPTTKSTMGRPGRLIWQNLVRPLAQTRENVSGVEHQVSVVRPESVVVELVDYTEMGEGKPIRGVWEYSVLQARIYNPATDSWTEQKIAAKDVLPGMELQGYSRVGEPHSQAEVRLDGKQKPHWFTVLEKAVHNLPISLAIGVEGVSDNPHVQEVGMALDHAVLIQQSKWQAAWRQGWHIDPGTYLWAGDESGRVRYLREIHEPRTLVEFSLGAEKRSLNPNNTEIKPLADASSPRLVVEARPMYAGPIDPHDLVRLADGSAIPLFEVKVNPDVYHPKIGTSIIKGVHIRPEDDPWVNNPLISFHPTTALKITESFVTHAFALEMADGTTLRLGPGNWLLAVKKGKLDEVRVDEKLRAGLDIVIGADETGQPKTVRLKGIRLIPSPSYKYILVELVNLKWFIINGIIVSADYRPWDERRIGLRGGVELARPAENSLPVHDQIVAVTPARAMSSSDDMRSITQAGVVVAQEAFQLPTGIARASLLKGELLATWDPALGVYAPGLVGAILSRISTRTHIVTAEKDGMARRLECGPAQPLLVKMPQPLDEDRFVSPRHLMPGDRVYVGLAGSTVAEPWHVTCVTPQFHAWIIVHDIVSPQRQMVFNMQQLSTNVGLGNSIAFLFGIPMDSSGAGRLAPPSQHGQGPGTGIYRGLMGGPGPDLKQEKRPRIVQSAQHLVSDRISIPPNALDLLKKRERDLLALFTQEKQLISEKTPETPVLLFWKKLLSKPHSDDRNGEEPLLPFKATIPRIAMDQWFREVIRQRRDFLEQNTNAAFLTRVAMLEVMTASWLWELRAKETANRLLLDLTELAILAGCEHDSPSGIKVRMGRDLELPVLLHVPNWVRGERRERGKEVAMSVSHPVLVKAVEWARNKKLRETIDLGEGQLSLSGLYAYWAYAASDRPVYWDDIPSPEQDGAFPDVREAIDFQTWLEKMSKRLFAEMPPTGNTVPLPSSIFHESFSSKED